MNTKKYIKKTWHTINKARRIVVGDCLTHIINQSLTTILFLTAKLVHIF